MDIRAVGSSAYTSPQGSEGFAKAKQLFQDLGKALDSGSLDDAKNALAQLQANAPAQARNGNNPLSAKIDALSKAVESGDLDAAKKAYAEIKAAKPQRPAGGPPPSGGAPPSGAGKSAKAGGTSSSSKTYDPADANKDGTVSATEKQDYQVKHPEKAYGTSKPSQLDVWA